MGVLEWYDGKVPDETNSVSIEAELKNQEEIKDEEGFINDYSNALRSLGLLELLRNYLTKYLLEIESDCDEEMLGSIKQSIFKVNEELNKIIISM